ncbi:MAG: hypothetical protein H0W44_09290 [Gammaproteobacteria bacterium]|nr:hypothetical protein [Gammaproteobacteria bacterium]
MSVAVTHESAPHNPVIAQSLVYWEQQRSVLLSSGGHDISKPHRGSKRFIREMPQWERKVHKLLERINRV